MNKFMDFAFLIHSRDYRDVTKKFKLAKFLPRTVIEFWCAHWPPLVVSKVSITGKETTGKRCAGYIIGIPMTAKQMIAARDTAEKRVIAAVALAEKLGAKIVGLGALTSSVTKGGETIKDRVGISLTTGNALTVATSLKHLNNIISTITFNHKIAIVGCTGSIGQAVAKQLVRKYPDKEFYLYARTPANLEKLIREIKTQNPDSRVRGFANDLSTLSEAQLLIIATSATEAIIHSSHLRENAVVYDMTQPQNVDRATLQERTDVTVFDGGLIFAPTLEGRLPFGLPKKVIYSCLGETMLLALENHHGHFALGAVTPDKVDYIAKAAEKHNFTPIKLLP